MEGCLWPSKGYAAHQVPKEVVEGKPLLWCSANLAQAEMGTSWPLSHDPCCTPQAEKIFAKEQTFAWRSQEFTRSDGSVSQAAQQCCHPAPNNLSADLPGTVVPLPPCSWT